MATKQQTGGGHAVQGRTAAESLSVQQQAKPPENKNTSRRKERKKSAGSLQGTGAGAAIGTAGEVSSPVNLKIQNGRAKEEE